MRHTHSFTVCSGSWSDSRDGGGTPPCRRAWLAAGLVLAGGLFCLLALSSRQGDAATPVGPTYSSTPPLRITEYILGVHPLHNPKKLDGIYGPLVDYLNARLNLPGVRLRLEASRSYAVFDEKIQGGHPHFAIPNPYQTIKAVEHGYEVFGKMDNDEDFRGIILLRRDSPIRNVSDLKGRIVAYPAPTALAAAMLPQMFLAERGLDVMHDLDNRYVGSQESAIMSVYVGSADAGVTWPPPWENFQRERPDAAAELYVAWRTESLPSNGLVVRADVPAEVRDRVAGLLFTLQDTPEGRDILARIPLSRFVPADDVVYAPVRDFIQRFEERVRKADQ